MSVIRKYHLNEMAEVACCTDIDFSPSGVVCVRVCFILCYVFVCMRDNVISSAFLSSVLSVLHPKPLEEIL